jgi:hypothetical protein
MVMIKSTRWVRRSISVTSHILMLFLTTINLEALGDQAHAATLGSC